VATASSPRMMTADELLTMPDDGNRYELVRGELIQMSPSAIPPGVVASSAVLEIGGFIKPNRLGVCGTADSGFRLSTDPDTVRAPDFWFVRAERVPAEGLPEGYWPGAPDLAVEVLSPSDRFVDVMRKLQKYLAAGTQLVWVIDPKGRSAAAFDSERPPLLLGEDDVLDGGAILAGFSIRLGDILP
jgi:Uma2 family endonuclease